MFSPPARQGRRRHSLLLATPCGRARHGRQRCRAFRPPSDAGVRELDLCSTTPRPFFVYAGAGALLLPCDALRILSASLASKASRSSMATVPWSRLCTRLSLGTGKRVHGSSWPDSTMAPDLADYPSPGIPSPAGYSTQGKKDPQPPAEGKIPSSSTAAPAAEHPHLSKDLFSQMRAAVRHVASLFPTAIVSGRSRDKVFDFVKLTELYYAGSNGMDIMGPIRKSESNGQHVQCVRSTDSEGKEVNLFQLANHWKFGTAGNNYFRHATRQLYAITRDLATYVSANKHILHKYTNEDVSFGSWLIGLDVEHVDERSLCCGIPPGAHVLSGNVFEPRALDELIPE
ncbi:hypothetical protein ZWY2020_037264 [Hordeum vulgare]|nr:hypothetical protein ZWY2020_037264 [Hordeum vulgare]